MKKIAIVTGASSGMGRQFALTVNDNVSVEEIWLIARGEKGLRETASLLPVPAKVIPLDLSADESFTALAEMLAEEKPDVRLLVNASGFGKFESVENMDLKDMEGMIDLNCKALVRISKLCLPYMSEGSQMIQIASMAAFQPIPYINVYGASKAFVLSFSRALNQEVKKKGIHSLAVCPYWTRTRFFERAVEEGKQIVKYYVVMYEPENIIAQSWKDLKKGKDVSIYGTIAKGQALLCKLLLHSLVMKIWQKQQDL